jgi:microcystin-dependent protein
MRAIERGIEAMGTPFLGEIKIISWNFPPKAWALANGQFLPINQNQALFALFGTMYGGNGQTTFAIPNLQGRCAMHTGAGFIQGQAGGSASVTINISQMPQHLHLVNAVSDNADAVLFSGNYLAGFNNGYRPATSLTSILPDTIANVGGSQPHENMAPYTVLNFIVALQGVFPSQN